MSRSIMRLYRFRNWLIAFIAAISISLPWRPFGAGKQRCYRYGELSLWRYQQHGYWFMTSNKCKRSSLVCSDESTNSLFSPHRTIFRWNIKKVTAFFLHGRRHAEFFGWAQLAAHVRRSTKYYAIDYVSTISYQGIGKQLAVTIT